MPSAGRRPGFDPRDAGALPGIGVLFCVRVRGNRARRRRPARAASVQDGRFSSTFWKRLKNFSESLPPARRSSPSPSRASMLSGSPAAE